MRDRSSACTRSRIRFRMPIHPRRHGSGPLADKFTPLILDALSRAAAYPEGCALLATKAEPGLFPATATARPAAKKALDDGLLTVLRTATSGKSTAEFCTASPKGLAYLMERASPKQVLEDFVRVLEERRGEVQTLLKTADRMAASLAGMTERIQSVLPQVALSRLPLPVESPAWDRGGNVALMPPAWDANELAERLIAWLAAWSSRGGVTRDCPLPELFRSLSTLDPAPSIGLFHDALRQLHDERRVYLHPYTGPLYTLPEPAYALMIGHEVSYYANAR